MSKSRSFMGESEFLRGVSNLLFSIDRRLLVVFCSVRFLNDTVLIYKNIGNCRGYLSYEPSRFISFSPPIIER